MCGIIALLGRPDSKNASRLLLDQYEMQAARGRQGFGLVEIRKTGFTIKRSMTEPRAMLDMANSDAKIMLFHHRFPTSTKNLHNQTHPILVSNIELENDWLVMHNGVISNDDELKEIHRAMGYTYNTEIKETYQYSGAMYTKFNDSEAFAIELARFIEGKGAIIGTQGSAAFIAMKIDKISGKSISIIIGRNDKNPLEMELLEEGILIASDIESDKKVEITPFKAYEILTKDLMSKTTFGKITELMPLVFAEIPTPKTYQTVGYGANDGHYGKHKIRHLPMKIDLVNEIDYPEQVFKEPIGEKEEAFDKMQDRVEDDIHEEVSMIFNELIFEDMDEIALKGYADRITDIIMSLRERANKAREFFDKAAIQEIDDYQKGKLEIAMYDEPY